jgi:Ca2+-binding EF-hand superfamily protein
MSKKVLLIAGVALAAGSVAAVSSPYFRDGQVRFSRMLDELGADDPEDSPRRSGRRHRDMDADRDGSGGRRSGRHFGASDQDGSDDSEGLTKPRRGRAAMRDVNDEERGQDLSERLWRWFGSRPHARRNAEEAEGEPGLGRNRREAGESRRASPERQAGRPDRQFARLDRNGDGIIDARDFEMRAAEIAANAAKRFLARYDADGDGKVSREEFERGAKDRSQERIAELEPAGEDTMSEVDQPTGQPRRGIVK